jgi:hypothetical protein
VVDVVDRLGEVSIHVVTSRLTEHPAPGCRIRVRPGSAYAHNTVQNQLAAEQIYFPAQSAFAHPRAGGETTLNMIRQLA